MSDQFQPESGGSRGCLFAALGVGCLLVLLLFFGAGALFFVRSSERVVTVPMRMPNMNFGEFPTDMVRDGTSVEAAFHLYSEGGARRADFGAIRLEWPDRGAGQGGSGTNITLAAPTNTGRTSSYRSGSQVRINSSNGVTTGQLYGASFTIKDGILTLDGQTFDAVNGPPTVVVLDKAGKITETRAYEAPIPKVEPAKPPASPEDGKDKKKP